MLAGVIPDLAIKVEGDIGRVTGNMTPTGHLGVGTCQGPCLDTVQEVPHVEVGGIAGYGFALTV